MIMRCTVCGTFLLFVFAYGCGSSGSIGGVSSSKKMNELTDEEVTKVCKALSKYDANMGSTDCTMQGLSADSKAECEQVRSACIAENNSYETAGNSGGAAGSGYDNEDYCNGLDASNVKGCPATVGELDSCVKSFANYMKSLSCDILDGSKSSQPPSCTTSLISKCPAVFGNMSMGF
jgi:hypothetical protein